MKPVTGGDRVVYFKNKHLVGFSLFMRSVHNMIINNGFTIFKVNPSIPDLLPIFL